MNFFNLFRKKKQKTQKDRPDIKSNDSIDVILEADDLVDIEIVEESVVEEPITIDNLSQEEINSHILSIAKEQSNYEILDLDYYYVDETKNDELLEHAARLIVIHQLGSARLIQQKFHIGFYRVSKIMDQLENYGIVGPDKGNFTPRDLLITDEKVLGQILASISYEVEAKERLKEEIKIRYKDEIDQKVSELIKTYMQKKLADDQAKEEKEKEAIRQQLLEKERLRKLKREVRQEMIESGEINSGKKRESISQDIQDKVWNRDGGKCVMCGSNENLEFDHIIPFSRGGANTYRNLQLLCQKCNREKSNKIG